MICIFALTTSSYRNPQGTNFAGAACDLLLPMLTSLNQFSLAVKTQVNLVFARLTVALSNPRFS